MNSKDILQQINLNLQSLPTFEFDEQQTAGLSEGGQRALFLTSEGIESDARLHDLITKATEAIVKDGLEEPSSSAASPGDRFVLPPRRITTASVDKHCQNLKTAFTVPHAKHLTTSNIKKEAETAKSAAEECKNRVAAILQAHPRPTAVVVPHPPEKPSNDGFQDRSKPHVPARRPSGLALDATNSKAASPLMKDFKSNERDRDPQTLKDLNVSGDKGKALLSSASIPRLDQRRKSSGGVSAATTPAHRHTASATEDWLGLEAVLGENDAPAHSQTAMTSRRENKTINAPRYQPELGGVHISGFGFRSVAPTSADSYPGYTMRERSSTPSDGGSNYPASVTTARGEGSIEPDAVTMRSYFDGVLGAHSPRQRSRSTTSHRDATPWRGFFETDGDESPYSYSIPEGEARRYGSELSDTTTIRDRFDREMQKVYNDDDDDEDDEDEPEDPEDAASTRDRPSKIAKKQMPPPPRPHNAPNSSRSIKAAPAAQTKTGGQRGRGRGRKAQWKKGERPFTNLDMFVYLEESSGTGQLKPFSQLPNLLATQLREAFLAICNKTSDFHDAYARMSDPNNQATYSRQDLIRCVAHYLISKGSGQCRFRHDCNKRACDACIAQPDRPCVRMESQSSGSHVILVFYPRPEQSRADDCHWKSREYWLA